MTADAGLTLNSQELEIAEKRVSGLTLKEIARDLDISEATVCRRLQDETIQDYCLTLQANLINTTLHKSTENIKKLVHSYENIGKDDPQLRDHGFKATLRVAELGVLPSQSNIQLTQNNLFISPLVDKVLSQISGNVIDITPEDE